MALYYFDLRDESELLVDEDGTELRDMRAVQDEAARTLSGLAWDAMRLDAFESQQMTLEVRNAHGRVMDVKLSFEVARRNGDTATEHNEPKPKEVLRLWAAFNRVASEEMREAALALAQRYASKSPEFVSAMLKLLQKLETKH